MKAQLQRNPPDDIKELLHSGQWTDAVAAFERLHPSDASIALAQLPSRKQRTIFKLLSYKAAAHLLPYLLYYDQFVLLHARTRDEMRQIVNERDADGRMRLIDELPENAWQPLMDELTEAERNITERFAKYPSNRAGRYLTPNFVSLFPDMRAKDALEEIRRSGLTKATIDVAYVVGSDGSLLDEVRLPSLVMANPNQLVTGIDDSALVVIRDTDSLPDVLTCFEKYDRPALPVVNCENKMLGILTFDNIMDVARSLATSDMQKMGGMEALDAPYFSVRLWEMLRKRGGWLAVLISR